MSSTPPAAPAPSMRGLVVRWLINLSRVFVWLVLAVLSSWAMAALYVDVRLSALGVPLEPRSLDFAKLKGHQRLQAV